MHREGEALRNHPKSKSFLLCLGVLGGPAEGDRVGVSGLGGVFITERSVQTLTLWPCITLFINFVLCQRSGKYEIALKS